MRRLLLFAILIALAIPVAAAMEPLTFEELVELLQAGLPEAVLLSIVLEIDPPSLHAHQWLELRRLGASDDVLLALLPPGARLEISATPVAVPAPVPTTAAGKIPEEPHSPVPVAGTSIEGASEVRAFYDQDPEGDRIFVLTNLDEEGERIGGRLASPVRRNVVVGRTAEEAEAEEQARQERDERTRALEAAAAQQISAALPPTPQPRVALLQEGYAGATAFVATGQGYGFFWGYPGRHLYPPGSYTHNKLYHSRGPTGFTHYQLPAGQVFYNPLFPGTGSHRRR